MNKSTLLAVSLLSLSLAGCMSTQNDPNAPVPELDFSAFNVSSPVEELAKEDIKTSQTIGQVVGGLAGLYICNRKIGNIPGRNAAITACTVGGAWLGGQIGENVGGAIAIRRLKYASEYEFLDSEIKASESALTTREAKLEQTKADIASAEKRISTLQKNAALTEAQKKEALALKADVTARMEDNAKQKELYDGILKYQDELLESSQKEIEGLEEDKAAAQAKHTELKEKREKLFAQLEVVNQQSEDLIAQNTALENMLAS